MSASASPIRRRVWLFAGAGVAFWALLWLFPLPSDALPIPRLLMLAMLVVVPLGLALASPPSDGLPARLYPVLHGSQPFAALLASIAFYLPPGITAALLAGPWALFCAAVALYGLLRIVPRGFGGAAESCLDAALLYIPVGAGWLILSRLGARPLGFDGAITALTAIHFHYAGFAAPIVAGMSGRHLAGTGSPLRPVFALASIGVIAGIALVALGITFSPLIEVAAALILAVSLGTVAVLTLLIVRSVGSVLPAALIVLSSLALIAGMLLAGVYAVGNFTGQDWLLIPRMVQLHGVANATGVILGLAGWALVRPQVR